jgi:hypothetical protein
VVDGVYRLDEWALLDEFFHFLRELGVMTLLEEMRGIAMHRVLVPFVQYLLLYGLKALLGIKSMNALPAMLFSEEAFMRLVGFNAPQVREGVCQRGRTKRQSQRSPGPICPDTLAKNMVKSNLRDLDALFNGVIRALAKAGVFGKRVTGIADGTDVETTERYEGCGQVTRLRHLADKQGKVHQIEVTVYGWKVLLLIDAVTKIPLAVKVVQIQEHEALWTRAVVNPSAGKSGRVCPPAQGRLR